MEPPESADVIQTFERLSGYKGVRYIDSYAGFRDWFIHYYGREGYTVELGKGKNPLPLKQFDDIYCKSRGILWASCFLKAETFHGENRKLDSQTFMEGEWPV